HPGHGVKEVLDRGVAVGEAGEGGAVGIGGEAEAGDDAVPLIEVGAGDAAVEPGGAADEAHAGLVGDVGGEDDAPGAGVAEAVAELAGEVGAAEDGAGAGKDGDGAVEGIGGAGVGLVVGDEVEMVLGVDVPVHAPGGEVAVVDGGGEGAEEAAVEVVIGADAADQAAGGAGELLDLGVGGGDGGIFGGGKGAGAGGQGGVGVGGQGVEVDGLDVAGGVFVGEDAGLGGGLEPLLVLDEKGLGEAEGLHGEEDEELVLEDGAADAAAELVEVQLVAGQAVDAVEVVVGFEGAVAVLLVEIAVPLVGALAGDELDLHRAFAEAVGAAGGGGDGDLFDGIAAGHDGVEDAVGAFEVVVLDVDAIEGDVDGGLGQAVDQGLADGVAGLGAGLGGDELGGVAAGEGQIVDLLAFDGGADGGGVGLDDLGAAGDLDGLVGLADGQAHVDGGGDGGINRDVGDGLGLEAGVGGGDGVGAGGDAGDGPEALGVGAGVEALAGGGIDDLDGRAGHGGVAGVGDGAAEPGGDRLGDAEDGEEEDRQRTHSTAHFQKAHYTPPFGTHTTTQRRTYKYSRSV